MVEIERQYDFSEIEARQPTRARMERDIAEQTCSRYIKTTGLETMMTTDDTPLTAKISPGLNTETTDITITPLPGQSITNIDVIMKVLRRIAGITIHATREPETVSFSRQYGNRTVAFKIKTRTPNPDELPPKAEDMSDTPDFGDMEVSEPAKEPEQLILPARKYGIIEVPAIRYARSAAQSLFEIEGFLIAGRREGHDIQYVKKTDFLEDKIRKLSKTVARLATSDGKKPLVALSPDHARFKIDVFPQKGTTITEFAQEGNSRLYDEQLRGIVTYRSEDFRVCVHRRNLYEKFNIRGPAGTNTDGKLSITPPSNSEYSMVMELLTNLPAPINIITDNDTEVTVAYQPQSFPTRIFLTPLSGARLVLSGLEEAKSANQNLRLAYLRKDGPGELYLPEDEGVKRALVLFTEPTSIRANWHEQGGTAKDCFDIFYEQFQQLAATRKQ